MRHIGWACSSAGEHYVDIVGVTSSILVTPTIRIQRPFEKSKGLFRFPRFLPALSLRTAARRGVYQNLRTKLPTADAQTLVRRGPAKVRGALSNRLRGDLMPMRPEAQPASWAQPVPERCPVAPIRRSGTPSPHHPVAIGLLSRPPPAGTRRVGLPSRKFVVCVMERTPSRPNLRLQSQRLATRQAQSKGTHQNRRRAVCLASPRAGVMPNRAPLHSSERN